MTDAFAFPFVDEVPFRWNSMRVQFIDPWRVPKALLLTATAIASLLH
jgi:hypothetical protein